MIRVHLAGAFALVLLAGSAGAMAEPGTAFLPDGTTKVPAFDLPASPFMSAEALAFQKGRAGTTSSAPPLGAAATEISAVRAGLEKQLAPQVAEMQKRYAVDVTPGTIAGVKVQTIMPKAGEANKSRVLINLHGGGFSMCAGACAMLESIPIAAVGRFKVVTVDYRQGPEHNFPAASEDVAAVYKDILKTYKPENVGIYGCSAGGALTAEATAWIIDKGMPTPGVIGIMGAGAVRFGAGDSAYISAYLGGGFAAPKPGDDANQLGYFKGADMNSPMVSPGAHLDLLKKFPPTIVVTGTRAPDLSPAVYSNSQLLKAGVTSELIVTEGQGHCYVYSSNLPEARDTYDIVVRFFNDHLGKAKKG